MKPRRPVPNLLTLLTALTLGLATSIAIAWSTPWWPYAPLRPGQRLPFGFCTIEGASDLWQVNMPAGDLPGQSIFVFARITGAPTQPQPDRQELPAWFDDWARTQPIPKRFLTANVNLLMLQAQGWPFRCVSTTRAFTQTPTTVMKHTPLWGIVIDDGRHRVVALRPLPLGLAANTAIYAAAWAVPLTLIPITRRHLRTRKGLCPRCGYDVQRQFTTPCPECGHQRSKTNPPPPA